MNQQEFQPEGFDELEFDQANELVRGRQRYWRKEKPAAHIVNQLLARKGYLQRQSSNELVDAWLAVVAKRWHQKTKVGTIKRGVLEILVQNPSVTQHLNFQKKKILKLIQERLPQNKITDIRFRVGKF